MACRVTSVMSIVMKLPLLHPSHHASVVYLRREETHKLR